MFVYRHYSGIYTMKNLLQNALTACLLSRGSQVRVLPRLPVFKDLHQPVTAGWRLNLCLILGRYSFSDIILAFTGSMQPLVKRARAMKESAE